MLLQLSCFSVSRKRLEPGLALLSRTRLEEQSYVAASLAVDALGRHVVESTVLKVLPPYVVVSLHDSMRKMACIA
jgi:hypothetical protein